MSDLHDEYAHQPTLDRLYEYIDAVNPELRIDLGDVFDFPGLRKGCSKRDEFKGWKQPIEVGKRHIERARLTHYIRGNHCQRVYEALESMSGLERYGAMKAIEDIEDVFKKIGTHTTRWGINSQHSGLLRIGQQGFCHGYGSGDSVWKDMAAAYCQNIMFGHIHAFGNYTSKNIYRHRSRSCASLADNRKMKYQLGQKGALCHESGFIICVYDKQHGVFHFFDCYWSNGVFIIPEVTIK